VTPSVCIPSLTAIGATWDPELAGQLAGAVARQAADKGAAVLLAPTVNLHRHPLWGRHFEAFSEDPLLTGKLAVAYIRAVQDQGVIGCVKHLVGNEAEFERNTASSEIDERTLRELYLLPFEYAVRTAGVLAVMTSYNRVNGQFANDDERLLTGILRREWGFAGFVMTDWRAIITTDAGSR
jgi:beta-glucosidase